MLRVFCTWSLLLSLALASSAQAEGRRLHPGIDVLDNAVHIAPAAAERLVLFAMRRGFSVGRAGSVFDIETGARVRLLGGVTLTGSYRLLGYDGQATGRQGLDPQARGPFVALGVNF
ncbi:hypothetical protein MK489_17755 [Myxococcota bacterium]|nr:hypothetical protein [Myxococcota bacterium]